MICISIICSNTLILSSSSLNYNKTYISMHIYINIKNVISPHICKMRIILPILYIVTAHYPQLTFIRLSDYAFQTYNFTFSTILFQTFLTMMSFRILLYHRYYFFSFLQIICIFCIPISHRFASLVKC